MKKQIEILRQKHLELMEQYEYQVKKMEESAEKAKDRTIRTGGRERKRYNKEYGKNT